MPWNEDQLYARFLTRERRYDGKFLTGVITTGIYCLPSCPARKPKRENVRFFHTPVEARESGLRPCRRCRPDMFYEGDGWHERIFEQTAARVRENPAAFGDVGAIATAAGLSRTALNDLFREHAQESPGAFLRSIRIERACASMRDGVKPTDAAAESGFESASAFHEQFTARTGMTPAGYAAVRERNEFEIRLPPGYRTDEPLRFLARDGQGVSERVNDTGFEKCFLSGERAGLLRVGFDCGLAKCLVDGADVFTAHRIAVRMLGLESDAAGFERQFARDRAIGGLIARQRGLHIPLTAIEWEGLAWAIMGQQITLAVAVTLRRNLIAVYGTPHASGLIAHPPAERIAQLEIADLRTLKFSNAKADYLIGTAKAITSGALPLCGMRRRSAHTAARLLSAVRGIGPWTVQYAMLRACGFPDCLPAGDAGLAQGLERVTGVRPTESEIRESFGRFAPYRSLATYHVWSSL